MRDFPLRAIISGIVTPSDSDHGLPNERPLDPFVQQDVLFEVNLRPSAFDDFQGQDKVRERLQLRVQAAKDRGDVLDHLLLSGPPGLGKTTLAHIIAQEMDSNIKITSGPMVEKAGDLAGLLTNLERGDILFIDEIHRLQPAIEEYLYPALEDYRLDIIIDQGPSARSIQLNLPRFTLIGATTRAGMLSSPLRSRLGLSLRLDYYQPADLAHIVTRSARLLELEILPDGAFEIARRSRGTPRIANNLLRWVRDYAQVRADGRITREAADAALNMLEIDADGLDEMDMRLLEALAVRYKGGPAGIAALAVAVGEEAGTLEEVHEPFLIMQGYLQRTPQGRIALPPAYDKLGLSRSAGAWQEKFF